MAELTENQRFLLNELQSCPDQTAGVGALRLAARHMTDAGFNRVVRKMDRQGLVRFVRGGKLQARKAL